MNPITKQSFRLPFKYSVRESETIKSFFFDTEGVDFSYLAGQYVVIRLEDVRDDPRGNLRQFSISSSPTENGQISITTTIEPEDSAFKNRLNSLELLELVTVQGPFGSFTLNQRPHATDTIVFIAGGIGITPCRSMIKYSSDMREEQTRIILLYSAKTEQNLIFKNELDRLRLTNPNLSVHYTITKAPGEKAFGGHAGRIDTEFIKDAVKESKSNFTSNAFYICGPPALVRDISSKLLLDIGVPRDKIKLESFTGY
jgi:ferredoxin-NADP reductase